MTRKISTGVISSENFEPGDEIDLPNVPYVDPGSADLNPDGASFYFETGQDQQNYVLQIVENDQTFDIPISQDEPLSGGFTLSDDGSGGTLVTYTANDVTNYSETATADPATLSSYAGVVHILVRQPGADTSYGGSGFAVGQKYDSHRATCGKSSRVQCLCGRARPRLCTGQSRESWVFAFGGKRSRR